MSVRVGYVNVQGMTMDKFDVCCRLLDTVYDYLFIAETWFVDHRKIKGNPRYVATTPKRGSGRPGRRANGGIYLLATKRARGKLTGVQVTPHSIVFQVGALRVGGVYLPPSMPDGEVRAQLGSLKDVTVVVGDVNVRFQNPDLQDGKAGPDGRLSVFTGWLKDTSRTQVEPDHEDSTGLGHWCTNAARLHKKWTLDHCFVKHQLLHQTQLRLLDTKRLGLKTDHAYAMHLRVTKREKAIVGKDEGHETRRFRLRRLQDPRVRRRIPLAMREAIATIYQATDDVDELNAQLTQICQAVAETCCGVCVPPSARRSHQTPKAQGDASYLRQYKDACRTSKENLPILPVDEGGDAMMENFDRLRARYSAERREPVEEPEQKEPRAETEVPEMVWRAYFAKDRIVAEIKAQLAEKSCGSDGVHIRLLKAFVDTDLMPLLEKLFQQCMLTGRTPRAWNQSEIHLLVKDQAGPRNGENMRPITIICMFRKIFERLLLSTFDGQGWARLHPTQAGFRGGYSVLTNAAIVHTLLATKQRTSAVFLDLRSAFDVVDHVKLRRLLIERDCPNRLVNVISSLMFDGIWSRLLINNQASAPFQRTCGVLQGSPQSPDLFNIFIDGLLHLLNAGSTDTPNCIFYADDGVILVRDLGEAQRLLDLAEAWTKEAGLTFNVKKCAVVSREAARLTLQGQAIPVVESYNYLGFPVTVDGINFKEHVSRRVGNAWARVKWLTLHSDNWGVANRLRVYNQYIAPMFEFGAPLVQTWITSTTGGYLIFNKATVEWKYIMAWIGGGTLRRDRVTANLLGLLPPRERFAQLKTQYQWVIRQLSAANPLRVLLQKRRPKRSFLGMLDRDDAFGKYEVLPNRGTEPKQGKQRLHAFLRLQHQETIDKLAQKAKMTKIIPMDSRNVPGLFCADVTLRAPAEEQHLLFAYRRNTFGTKKKCSCGKEYHRMHENCPELPHPVRLSHEDRRKKALMFAGLHDKERKVTDIDYLLNTGRLVEAATILKAVYIRLGKHYHEVKVAEKAMAGP
jgi:hypothetical protein